jgi:hypothetical protein
MADEIIMFISYDYDEDRHYKNLLMAWSAHEYVNFQFYDHSTDISVKSDKAAVIKRVISRRIRESTHFLCIIGEKTHRCEWVNWEIMQAVELEKEIIAVKTKWSNISPPPILSVGARWSKSFTLDAITKAVEQGRSTLYKKGMTQNE